MSELKQVLRTAPRALLLVLALNTWAWVPAKAQEGTPVVAIDPVVGPPGTLVSYLGVGFTPRGPVSVLLVSGLGLVVGELTAGPTGVVGGEFEMPDSSWLAETGFGHMDVFAIDEATGRNTLAAPFSITPALALDYPLPNGHFFTQGNGFPPGERQEGFQVVNSQPYVVQVPLFEGLARTGGVQRLGFPVSRPFVANDYITQIFQQGVIQWQQDKGRAFIQDVFDELHDAGYDDLLLQSYSVPPELDFSAEQEELTSLEIVQRHLTLLDSNPTLRDYYFAAHEPLTRFGLPTSRAEDMGDHFAIRLQRAVLRAWKAGSLGTGAIGVSVIEGGDLAREVGYYPSWVFAPENAPTFSESIVAYGPRRRDPVSSPIVLRGDARAYEATFIFDLIGERGNVLGHGFTMATAGGPLFGRYSAQLEFQTDREQQGIPRLYELSARDGEIVRESLVLVPLALRP